MSIYCVFQTNYCILYIMEIITRFAPSPSGFLHIGGARTALFNWLYAKHFNGKFLLRIEDTDKKKSQKVAIDAIIKGLIWLGLKHDEEIIFQSNNLKRHASIARYLISKEKAYYCYAENSINIKKNTSVFRSEWRDKINNIQNERKPVVRIKIPSHGLITINDEIYGKMKVENHTIEDFVILRSDGTPTYMLSSVVDDYDMNISHVIRGSDHITNTAKQILIYNALGWQQPVFAHIPLIHGSDGNKMSKRDGALGVEEYEKMGFLATAMRNYLFKLGWNAGDEEIISDRQAIKLFDFTNIGKSPSKFDIKKLQNINNLHLRKSEDIIEKLIPFTGEISLEKKTILSKVVSVLLEKSKTLVDLAKSSEIFISDDISLDEEALKTLNIEIALDLISNLRNVTEWNKNTIMMVIEDLSTKHKKKEIYQTLRAALTGTMNSPVIIVVILALGKCITLKRLNNLF